MAKILICILLLNSDIPDDKITLLDYKLYRNDRTNDNDGETVEILFVARTLDLANPVLLRLNVSLFETNTGTYLIPFLFCVINIPF